MSQLGITAVNVFIEINGRQCIAPIKAESVDMFVGMLAAFQGESSSSELMTLPDSVSRHLIELRKAMFDYINQSRKKQS